jgi:hypothetical protein
LRFKAENGRDIYLRDKRDQVTGQPSMVVVRSAVVFGHGHLLEEVGEFWDFPLHHFCGATSWRRRGVSVLELCSESLVLADEATRATGARAVVSAME